MREIITIILIIVIVIFSAIIIHNYLHKTSHDLIEKLEDLKKDIINKRNSNKELEEKAKSIYGEWKRINKKWSMIVLHDEIDSIETAFIRLNAKIATGFIKESIEDLDTSVFLIKHIEEKEKTNIKNIF